MPLRIYAYYASNIVGKGVELPQTSAVNFPITYRHCSSLSGLRLDYVLGKLFLVGWPVGVDNCSGTRNK